MEPLYNSFSRARQAVFKRPGLMSPASVRAGVAALVQKAEGPLGRRCPSVGTDADGGTEHARHQFRRFLAENSKALGIDGAVLKCLRVDEVSRWIDRAHIVL